MFREISELYWPRFSVAKAAFRRHQSRRVSRFPPILRLLFALSVSLSAVSAQVAAPVKPPTTAKPAQPPEKVREPAPPPAGVDADDTAAIENADDRASAAKPVTSDAVQVYGWREMILVAGVKEKLRAKLDSGAYTCSIHAEEVEMFERDGRKWVRFIVTDPTVAKAPRTRIEAPFVRIARVKEPGAESIEREVVKLSFQIGDRKFKGEFTLNNRKNMLAPVLIGRNMLRTLGWVDPSRTDIADQKIMR